MRCTSRSEQLAALTVRHAAPTISQYREFVAAGGLPSGWRPHRPHSQGRNARRPAASAIHQSRAIHQPQDRQGTRLDRAADGACPRRRGDRVNHYNPCTSFVSVHESVSSTSRRFAAKHCSAGFDYCLLAAQRRVLQHIRRQSGLSQVIRAGIFMSSLPSSKSSSPGEILFCIGAAISAQNYSWLSVIFAQNWRDSS
jgi:hypothetical protein